MTARTYNVLFLCTGNSARSIIAEVLLNHWGKGKFRAYSAGSFPKGAVHPMSLELLKSMKLPTEGLRSKSWDEFARAGAPQMDFVFTVCDQAAGGSLPNLARHAGHGALGYPRSGGRGRHGTAADASLSRGGPSTRHADQTLHRVAL